MTNGKVTEKCNNAIDKYREITPDVIVNESMSRHTTFKLGGTADVFISIKGIDELSEIIRLSAKEDIPVTVIGNGSNLLVKDGGIRGLVVEIGSGLSQCEVNGNIIYAHAGIKLSKLAATAAANGLSGMEEISGIPGTLGGAIYMNAGAYGGEIKNIVKSVTYMDDKGLLHTVKGSECEFGYRKSIFTDGGKYILAAELELAPREKSEINADMAEYTRRRREKQPISMPSAGSTFKRPEGYFAGDLIERSGLKGYKSGGAMVSDLHAGFVVNCGDATAKDVLDVIGHVQAAVAKKFDVLLEPEIKIIGDET